MAPVDRVTGSNIHRASKTGDEEADFRYALLIELPATILWEVDEALLLTASRIKAVHPLSLGDAIIAAYAIAQDAILVHKDPEYEVLSNELRLEALPYKGRGRNQN